MQQMTSLESYRVSGILETVDNIESKALLLEKEVGLESFYTLLSMGKKLAVLADSVGLSLFEMEYILKRTPDNRHSYIMAELMLSSEGSMKALKHFESSKFMEQEENNAAKHHKDMVGMTLKHTNPGTEDGSGKVVVHNNITISSKEDIPEVPDDLAEILEGEFEYVDT